MKRIAPVLLAACAAQSNPSNVSFGGAQDFGEFRGILDRGEIPAPDTLDANGFFNEHYAPPPAATCGGALCMTSGVMVGTDWLTGAHQMTLALALSSPIDPTTYTRKPLNLVVVIDHSGSMASDGRLDKVSLGLSTMIDHLQDGDQVALVEFDDRVDILARFGTDRTTLHSIVDQLAPRGSTDIFDGLKAGFQLAADALSRDRQNRVIFLSDGLANVGTTSPSAIIAMADGFSERGIGLTTIGVGNEFDVELMRGLAEHGAGNFYFLEDPAAATDVFSKELDYFVEPIALGIDVRATASSGYRFAEVVGSTMWQATAIGGTLHVPAAFIAGRTSNDPGGGRRGGGSMLFLHLDPIATGAGDVADVTLTYKLPTGEQQTQHITVGYGGDDPYLSAAELAPRFGMYNMFLGLRYAAQQGPSACAAAALASTRAGAVAWNQLHQNPDITADLALLDEYSANLQAAGVAEPGTLATCANATDPYQNEPEHPSCGGVPACGAGGTPGAFALIGLAGLVAVRRRRVEHRNS